jgi:membrane associated rhomboid family serine protease
MNWLLIAVNVLVFLGQGMSPAWTIHYGLSPKTPTLIQFFSYPFLHGNLTHLAGNMLFLYIFGNNVNDKMGQLGYLAFYMAGGIFAGIFYVLTDHHGAPVIGASGAVAAITGAYLVLFPRSNITVAFFLFYIAMVEIQSLWFILLFFAMDIFMSGGGDSVAHMAHIGGTLFGASICLLLVITHLIARDQFDVWALVQRWNKRRQYRDMVSKGYDPFNYVPPERDGRRLPDAILAQVQTVRAQISDALGKRDMESAAKLYLELKSLDSTQVMSRQGQLDIATQLHHTSQYPQAAEAYEGWLKTYPTGDRLGHVQLALGLVYARYLNQPDRARTLLKLAVDRFHEGREHELAEDELQRLPAEVPARTS